MFGISDTVVNSRYLTPVFVRLYVELMDLAIKLLFSCRKKVAGATVDRFEALRVLFLSTGTSQQVNYGR